jgi:uncharacterized protein (DUF2147 family)
MRILAMTLAVCLLGGGAAAAKTVAGQWLTEDGGGVIRIAPCGAVLCGRIVGMTDFGPSGTPKDVQGRSQCGLEIIHELRQSEAGLWSGTITNPEDGRTYDAQLSVDAAGRLLVRGFLGIPLFGATQIWTPYPGVLTEECRMFQ